MTTTTTAPAPDEPPTYCLTLAPEVVAQIAATAMCLKCAHRRRRERLRRIAAQDAARQNADRPVWDTRCVRGCGERVLDSGERCEDCTWADVRTDQERIVAAVRQEWAWVLEREAK